MTNQRTREGQSITTTCGEQFSWKDSCRLAHLIYVRFGRDIEAGAAAWRRLLQNSCTNQDFEELVNEAALHSTEEGRSF